jgi:GT2 family glycosyltransferase
MKIGRCVGQLARKGIALLPRIIGEPLMALPILRPRSKMRAVPSLRAATFKRRPKISIVMPTYNVEPRWLRRAVASVLRQSYPEWELCIVDDASPNEATRREIRRLARRLPESRLKIHWRPVNGGIATATNDGIELATGEYIGFLDNDDELHPQALAYVVKAINDDPLVDAIYTDQDKIDGSGHHFEPFYKPDWSPWYFRGAMYVGHFLVMTRDLVRRTGRWDPSLDIVADFDFMLRASEHAVRIRHVPHILYHWRALQSSGASHADAKPGTGAQQCRAVNAHLERIKVGARAEPHPTLPHRVCLRPVGMQQTPKVTVIIPTKDAPELLERCLSTLFSQTAYPRWEVVVVDTGSTNPRAIEILGDFEREKPAQFKRIDLPGPFNYSRANNVAVEHSDGELLVFLNNDTEIIQPEWLDQMVMLATVEGVAAVGAQLIYPNGTVQHAGVALGLRGTADHVMRGFPADGDGYAGSLCCVREVAAVSAACMMVRRSVFLEVGGFDEYFGTHYQDVDLCLAFVKRGYSNLYAAGSRVVHHESATRGTAYDLLDRQALIDRWERMLSVRDPFHNPAVPGYHA